jgi:hypothetical protein
MAAGASKLRVKQASQFGHPGRTILNLKLDAEFSDAALLEKLEENRARRNLASVQFLVSALNASDVLVQEDKLIVGQDAEEQIAEAKGESELSAVMRAQSAIVGQQAAMIEHLLEFTTTNLQGVVKSQGELNEKIAARMIEQDKHMASLVEETLEIARMQQEREQAKLEAETKQLMQAELIDKGLPVIASLVGRFAGSDRAQRLMAFLQTLTPQQKEALMAYVTPEQRIMLGDVLLEEDKPAAQPNGAAS